MAGKYPLVDKGVVFDPEFQVNFVYRSYVYQRIGYGYIYPMEKTVEMLEFEMKILEMGDEEAVLISKGKRMPILWEDGVPEIPVAEMNIYELINSGKWELKEVDDEFGQNHLWLYEIYTNAWMGHLPTDEETV